MQAWLTRILTKIFILIWPSRMDSQHMGHKHDNIQVEWHFREYSYFIASLSVFPLLQVFHSISLFFIFDNEGIFSRFQIERGILPPYSSCYHSALPPPPLIPHVHRTLQRHIEHSSPQYSRLSSFSDILPSISQHSSKQKDSLRSPSAFLRHFAGKAQGRRSRSLTLSLFPKEGFQYISFLYFGFSSSR